MTNIENHRVYHREAHRAAKHRHAPDALKRAVILSAFTAVVIALLALVIVSPLALRQLGSLRGVDWSRLSNIGQTYGAASALLTGLALIGVAGSIVFQVRAIQVSRAQAIREQHTHLIEMALADPVYQRAWGGLYDKYGSFDEYRQHGYINLIVSFWQDHYVIGGLQDQGVRSNSEGLFRGEAGRNFWTDTRDMRLQTAKSRRDRKFCEIMEEEYQRAISAGPPAVKEEWPSMEPSPDQRMTLHHSVIRDGVTLLLGAAGGIIFESFANRRKLLWSSWMPSRRWRLTGLLAVLVVLARSAGALVMPPVIAVLANSVPVGRAGMATGGLNTSRQVRGALAIAVFGALAANRATLLPDCGPACCSNRHPAGPSGDRTSPSVSRPHL